MLPKVGPLKDLAQHRGIYLMEISDLDLVDDWEIELELKKQEVSPVELEDFEDFCPYHLALCESTDIKYGVLDEEHLDRSRKLFQELYAELRLLNI